MSKSLSSSSQLPQDQLVQAIYKQVNELTGQVNVLCEENQQLRLATNSLNLTPMKTIKDPKVTPPERFSGDRKLSQLYFTMQGIFHPSSKHLPHLQASVWVYGLFTLWAGSCLVEHL